MICVRIAACRRISIKKLLYKYNNIYVERLIDNCFKIYGDYSYFVSDQAGSCWSGCLPNTKINFLMPAVELFEYSLLSKSC